MGVGGWLCMSSLLCLCGCQVVAHGLSVAILNLLPSPPSVYVWGGGWGGFGNFLPDLRRAVARDVRRFLELFALTSVGQ